MEGGWIGSNYNYNSYQPLRHYEINTVKGEAGALNFRMAPNSRTILADETGAMIWVVQTDAAGFLTAFPYDITPHKSQPTIDINNLADRVAQLEEMLNAKSNSRTNKSRKHAATTTDNGPTDTTD